MYNAIANCTKNEMKFSFIEHNNLERWVRNLGTISIWRCLTSIGIPMLKIRRSHDHLIFNMGISIPGKDGLYIETGLWISHPMKWTGSPHHGHDTSWYQACQSCVLGATNHGAPGLRQIILTQVKHMQAPENMGASDKLLHEAYCLGEYIKAVCFLKLTLNVQKDVVISWWLLWIK